MESWWKEEILVEYGEYERVVDILQDSKRDEKEDNMYTFLVDLILYKNHLYLVPNSEVKEINILIECHSSHVVFFKTYYNARRKFFWKGLKEDVKKIVASCETCERIKQRQ